MPDETDQIRARINIVDLVGQRVLLKRAGKDWKGLCPFHDDRNPSFVVSERLGRYKCWSCGASGDIFNWVMETQRVSFREALEILARDAGITLSTRTTPEAKSKSEQARAAMSIALKFFREELAKSSSAREYCESRGLTDTVIVEWQIGYAPDVGDALASRLKREGFSLAECKELFLVDEDASGGFYDRFRGRLMFPIHDEQGRLVAFGGRLLGDGMPKYINSGDTPIYSKRRVLYGMHKGKEAIGKAKSAVLVEGYLDVIACHRAGVGTAVASLGTALSEEHARLLRRWCDEVRILYDADAAGQAAAERAADTLQAEGLKARIALMPQGEDPDTLLRTAGPAAVMQAVERGLPPLDFRLRQIREAHEPSEEAFWQEAVGAIAKEPSAMERARHIVSLAHIHPVERDPDRAERVLKSQVASLRRQLARQRTWAPDEPSPVAAVTIQRVIAPKEAPLFLAIMDTALRPLAWGTLAHDHLFLTHTGRELATALLASFPDGPPLGEPSVWLASVEPDWAREMLAELSLTKTLRLLPEDLTGAVLNLEAEHAARTRRELARDLDDETLKVYAERLKADKPDSRTGH